MKRILLFLLGVAVGVGASKVWEWGRPKKMTMAEKLAQIKPFILRLADAQPIKVKDLTHDNVRQW